MAGKLKYSLLTRDLVWNAIAAGFVNGVIRGFSGVQAPETQTDPGVPVCIEFTKNGGVFVPGQPANGFNFGASAAGIITSDGSSYQGNGLVAAQLSWFRLYNNDLTRWIQGSAGISNAVMTVTTTSIVVGGPVAVLSFQFSY